MEETILTRVMGRWSGGRNSTPSSRASLQMLARNPMPSIEETRKSCVSNARLLDISQTGMLVISTTVPPADQRIWLRLENPQRSSTGLPGRDCLSDGAPISVGRVPLCCSDLSAFRSGSAASSRPPPTVRIKTRTAIHGCFAI
jgi:hypothetical protein